MPRERRVVSNNAQSSSYSFNFSCFPFFTLFNILPRGSLGRDMDEGVYFKGHNAMMIFSKEPLRMSPFSLIINKERR